MTALRNDPKIRYGASRHGATGRALSSSVCLPALMMLGAAMVPLTSVDPARAQQFFDGGTPGGPIGGGSGPWDATTANWNDGAGNAVVYDPTLGTATFGTGASTGGTVTVAGPLGLTSTVDFAATTDNSIFTLAGGSLVVASGGTVFSVADVTGNASTDAQIASALTGTDGLTKTGAGRLGLSGANTFTGTTTINAGTLALTGSLTSAVSNNAAFVNSGTVSSTVANTGTLTNSGALGAVTNSSTGSLTNTGTLASLTNEGTVVQSAGSTGTTINSGSITAAGGTFTGPITNDAPGVFEVSGNVTAGDAFTNAIGASLRVTGGNFSGVTTLANDGSVLVSSTRTLSVAALTGTTASAVVEVDGTLTIGGITTDTYAGLLTGGGTITRSGTGTTVLTGTNTASNSVTGTFDVNDGTLLVNGVFGDLAGPTLNQAQVNVASGGTLGGSGRIAGNVTIANGGTLSAGGTASVLPGTGVGTLTIDGNLVLNASSISSFNLGTAGIAGAPNDLVKVGNSLTLDGTINVNSATSGSYRLFNYGTLINNTATVINAIGTATLLTNIPNQVNVSISNGGQGVQYWDGADTTGAFPTGADAVDGGSGTWDTAGTNWTTGSPSGINDSWGSEVGIFAGARGDVTVTGTMDFEGLQFVTGGYTVNGGTLNMTGNAVAGGNAEASFVRVDASNVATIGSVLDGDSIGLDKLGGGKLILSEANIYSGLTDVRDGVLKIVNGDALGSVARGTIVRAGAALEVEGGISVDAETLELTGTGISGGGALRSVSGDNVYGGAITLAGASRINSDAGTLTLSAADTISGIDTDLFLGGAGNGIVGGIVALGTGEVIKDGAGTWTLAGANTYAGLTDVQQGVLKITNSAALGTVAQGTTVRTGAALELAGGIAVDTETLELAGTGISGGGALRSVSGDNLYGGAITLAGASRINSDAGTLTLSAADTIGGTDTDLFVGGAGNGIVGGIVALGTGVVIKDGTGAWSLAGANTYAGLTDVQQGVLKITNGDALGSVAQGTTVRADAALELSGGISIGAETLELSGTGISDGGALRNVSGANVYGGAITLADDSRINSDAGTLTLSALDTIGGTDTDLLLGGAGDGIVGGIVALGTGEVIKDGVGTWVLAGANTYAGLTEVQEGVLKITNGDALGSVAEGTIVRDGTALELEGDIAVGAEALELTGIGISGGGALRNVSGDNLYGGAITLVHATRINSDAGTLTLSAADTISGTDTDLLLGGAGDGVVGGTAQLGTGAVIKDGAGTWDLAGANTYSGGTLVSEGVLRVSNSAALGSGGVWMEGGALAYDDGLTIDNAIAALGTTTFRQDAGSVTQAGTVFGSGALVKTGAGAIDFSSLDGDFDSLTVAGGSLTAANFGVFANAGTVLDVQSGNVTFDNFGTVSGTIDSAAGSTLVFNNVSADTLAFAPGSTSVLSGDDTIDNSGRITFEGATTVAGVENFFNTGLIAVAGAEKFSKMGVIDTVGGSLDLADAGTFTNSGTIDLRNGALGDSLRVDGDFTAQQGSRLLVDVDLGRDNSDGGQLSDQLVVTGTGRGTATTIAFNNIADGDRRRLQSAPIVVGDFGGSEGSAPIAEGLEKKGLVLYDLTQGPGGDWLLRSRVNTDAVGGLVANISTSQTLIASSFARPSSSFVAAPIQPEPDSTGAAPWFRAIGGTRSSSTTSIADNLAGGTDAAAARISLDYGGVQGGFDIGRFNIDSTGWNVNIGLTGGFNHGRAEQSGISNTTSFDTSFIGTYAAVSKGNFFGELQARWDYTDFSINAPDFSAQTIDTATRRSSVSGSAGYALEIGEGASFVPSVGLSYSILAADAIETDLGSLAFKDRTSIVGYASGTLARTILISEQTMALTPFLTATIYNDFGDDALSVFRDPADASINVVTEKLDTYGEISLGLNYRAILDKNPLGIQDITAGVRADFTVGQETQGSGVTGQVRLQF